MIIGLGTLQDEFELSGEYQAFRGWEEALRRSGAQARLFSSQGGRLRAAGMARVQSGEFVLKTFLEQWSFIRQALKIAASVDVLHVFLPNPGFLWIADAIKKKAGRPVVATCLGEKAVVSAAGLLRMRPQALRFHGARYLASKILPKSRFSCERYVVGSAHAAEQLCSDGCPPEKIVVSLPRLPAEAEPDAESRALAERMGRRQTFLYLGHFLPNKGVDVALRAFAHLNDAAARLVLVFSGLGSEVGVRKLAGELGIARRMDIVARPVHRSSVLSAACGVLLPFRVPFGQVAPPLVLLEALRCGAPVIAPDFPSLAGFGGDGTILLRARAEDTAAWAGRMRWLLENPEKARAMRAAQREFWKKESSAAVPGEVYGGLG